MDACVVRGERGTFNANESRQFTFVSIMGRLFNSFNFLDDRSGFNAAEIFGRAGVAVEFRFVSRGKAGDLRPPEY